jgi:tetratricopeptide (TPR) repeat protein
MFWIEHKIFGKEPLGYHVVNVVLHALAACLLLVLLRLLAVPGACFAAALFAVHPVHVESVAWVTERKNVLSLVFFLACLIVFWKARRSGPLPPRTILWTFGLFALALLAKTVTVTTPAVMLLILFWKRQRLLRSDGIVLVPMVLLGLGFGLLTAHLERVHVGAEGILPPLAWDERLMVAGRAFWFYLGKLLFPHPLSFNYERFDLHGSALALYGPAILFLLLILGLYGLRSRVTNGPLVAVLFFAGVLTPALGFFDVFPFRYSYVADHFQYHASVGILALLAAVTSRVFSSLRNPAVLQGAKGTLLVACLFLTRSHIETFTDLETLWTKTLERNPESSLAIGNLGQLRLAEGKLEQARAYLSRAIQIDPLLYEAHNGLGVVHHQKGEYAAAADDYDQAVRIKPDFVSALCNRAVLHHNLGENEIALDLLNRAESVRGDAPAVLENQAVVLLALSRHQESLVKAQALLRFPAKESMAHRLLAESYEGLGRESDSLAAYQRHFEASPRAVHSRDRFADALERSGQSEHALMHWAIYCAGNPGNDRSRDRLLSGLLRSNQEVKDLSQLLVRYLGKLAPQVLFEVSQQMEASDSLRSLEFGRIAVELARRLGLREEADRFEAARKTKRGGE